MIKDFYLFMPCMAMYNKIDYSRSSIVVFSFCLRLWYVSAGLPFIFNNCRRQNCEKRAIVGRNSSLARDVAFEHNCHPFVVSVKVLLLCFLFLSLLFALRKNKKVHVSSIYCRSNVRSKV